MLKLDYSLEEDLLTRWHAVNDRELDPSGSATATTKSIRAEVVREVILRQRNPEPLRTGLRISGVEIVGQLDLQDVTFEYPLEIIHCHFRETVCLAGAKLVSLSMVGSFAEAGVVANGSQLSGSLDLSGGFRSSGSTSLVGARVHGLDLSHADLDGCGASALDAERLTVAESLQARGLRAQGEVKLYDARIGRQLGFQEAKLHSSGRALNAYGIEVGGAMLCSEGFTADGEIWLLDARISGQLNFRGAKLRNESGGALQASNLHVGGSLFLDNGFVADGGVQIPGAHVGGQLSLQDGTFRRVDEAAIDGRLVRIGRGIGATGMVARGRVTLRGVRTGGAVDLSRANFDGTDSEYALDLDAAVTGGSVYLREGAESEGAVRCIGAQIGGQLDLRDSRIRSLGEKRAFDGERMHVKGSLLAENLVVEGGACLVGARIDDKLSLQGASLLNPAGSALDAARAKLAGGLSIWKAQVVGKIRLQDAEVAGVLMLSGATLTVEDGLALDADRLRLEGSFFLREGFESTGELRLRGARIKGQTNFESARLRATTSKTDDDPPTVLDFGASQLEDLRLRFADPPQGRVSLRDCQLRLLQDDPATWGPTIDLVGCSYERLRPMLGARERLAWIARDPGGYDPGLFDELASAFFRLGREEDARSVLIEKQRARRQVLGAPRKAWAYALGAVVGYGYRSWLALVWLAVIWLVGVVVFRQSYPEQLEPAEPTVAHQGFEPTVYSLDVLLPLVDLGQQSAWIPMDAARWWYWISVVAGWLLVTAALAGLTGLLRRAERG